MSSSSSLSSSSASSNSRTVVDPASGLGRDLSSCASIWSTLCCCSDCGEVFMKSENLELHQVVRHAVTELGPGDTSKSVVEIIFQSNVAEDHIPTIAGFEQHRDSIKSRAATKKRNLRCLADSNELLGFYCTSLGCSLGLNGSTNLCTTGPRHFSCGVCNIIRNGFESR